MATGGGQGSDHNSSVRSSLGVVDVFGGVGDGGTQGSAHNSLVGVRVVVSGRCVGGCVGSAHCSSVGCVLGVGLGASPSAFAAVTISCHCMSTLAWCLR